VYSKKIAEDILESTMTANLPRISLPKAWPTHVASAVLHVISLAQFATAYTRGWAANSINARIRLKAKLELANQENGKASSTGRVVTAKRPNHAWHVDLTAVPIGSGFWISWLPFALPQSWPFCWWVAVAVDHYSRRVMGFAVFNRNPSSESVLAFLGRTIHANQATPKYIISDKGSQFWCEGFKAWCKKRCIKPRFGAIGRHGSIAVIERFVRSLKDECTRRLRFVPYNKRAFQNELRLYIDWHNEQQDQFPNLLHAKVLEEEVDHADFWLRR
jgi:transposase InsO family protein